MPEVPSAPVPRGDPDSATPLWVDDLFQATENEYLEAREEVRVCVCVGGGGLGRFSFQTIREVFTLQLDSLQTTRNKSYP